MNSFGDDESPLDNFSYNEGDLSLFSPDTIPAERADAIRKCLPAVEFSHLSSIFSICSMLSLSLQASAH